MTIEQRIYNGEQARAVLENEAFQAAFADIKQEYTQAWMNSPARDAEGRETLYLMLRSADKLQATLTGMLEDGKMARIQQQHEENLLSKQRSYGVQHG